MLSERSICNTCNNKSICKHYDYAINNIDISLSINSCNSYNAYDIIKESSSINKVILPNKQQDDPITMPLKTYNDFNNVTNITDIKFKKDPLKVIPVKVAKGICSICGKEAQVENCSDCGKPVCSECSYTNVDVTNGKPIVTCDKCFGDKSNDDNNTNIDTDWNISKFTIDNSDDNKEKEVKVDDTTTKSTTRRTSRKSIKKSKEE